MGLKMGQKTANGFFFGLEQILSLDYLQQSNELFDSMKSKNFLSRRWTISISSRTSFSDVSRSATELSVSNSLLLL
jgi:hypothetical protein